MLMTWSAKCRTLWIISPGIVKTISTFIPLITIPTTAISIEFQVMWWIYKEPLMKSRDWRQRERSLGRGTETLWILIMLLFSNSRNKLAFLKKPLPKISMELTFELLLRRQLPSMPSLKIVIMDLLRVMASTHIQMAQLV